MTGTLRALLAATVLFFASAGAFIAYWLVIAIVIVASGGAIFECDRGDCGGTYRWVEEPNLAVAAVGGTLSLAVGALVLQILARGESR